MIVFIVSTLLAPVDIIKKNTKIKATLKLYHRSKSNTDFIWTFVRFSFSIEFIIVTIKKA